MKEKVVIIIPAYNEEGRVGNVVETAVLSRVAEKVLVVDDGSEDKTADEAAKHGAEVLRLEENSGKAAAVYRGISENPQADIYLLLDADLIGLKPEHIKLMLEPLTDNKKIGMVLGRFKKGRFATNFSQFVTPNITGQRAIRKELALKLPRLDKFGFAIELFLNDFCLKNGYELLYVDLVGVSQYMKEEKIGFFMGLLFRMKMYRDILIYLILKFFGKIQFRQ